jgi:hypothetical protein
MVFIKAGAEKSKIAASTAYPQSMGRIDRKIK